MKTNYYFYSIAFIAITLIFCIYISTRYEFTLAAEELSLYSHIFEQDILDYIRTQDWAYLNSYAKLANITAYLIAMITHSIQNYPKYVWICSHIYIIISVSFFISDKFSIFIKNIRTRFICAFILYLFPTSNIWSNGYTSLCCGWYSIIPILYVLIILSNKTISCFDYILSTIIIFVVFSAKPVYTVLLLMYSIFYTFQFFYNIYKKKEIDFLKISLVILIMITTLYEFRHFVTLDIAKQRIDGTFGLFDFLYRIIITVSKIILVPVCNVFNIQYAKSPTVFCTIGFIIIICSIGSMFSKTKCNTILLLFPILSFVLVLINVPINQFINEYSATIDTLSRGHYPIYFIFYLSICYLLDKIPTNILKNSLKVILISIFLFSFKLSTYFISIHWNDVFYIITKKTAFIPNLINGKPEEFSYCNNVIIHKKSYKELFGDENEHEDSNIQYFYIISNKEINKEKLFVNDKECHNLLENNSRLFFYDLSTFNSNKKNIKLICDDDILYADFYIISSPTSIQ